jgi:hypothetical protein
MLGSGVAIAPSSDYYDITLTEGEIAEIQDGYYLSVIDVNTDRETARFIVSYYDTSVLDQYYAIGDYLYYEDSNIVVQFKVSDVYYDSYYGYDYVVISDLYLYPDYTVTYDDSSTARTDTDYSDFTFVEGDVVEIQDGYHLTVEDVDTYSETVRFILSYYDTSVLDQYYAIGDYLYYEDRNIVVQFRVSDVYYDSYYGYDYVVISDLYLYPDYTVTYVYSDYDRPDTSDEDALYEMISTLIFIFIVALVLRKISKNRKKNKVNKNSGDGIEPKSVFSGQSQNNLPDSKGTVDAVKSSASVASVSKDPKKKPVVVKSAIQYKGSNILYKIKVENPSEEPLGDITISLFVPEVFHVKESRKNISMLQSGEGKTVTFIIRPTGECGDCILSGNIRYYDYSMKKHVQVDLSNKMVNIVCPVLKVMEIDENNWRLNVSSMMIAEEDTKDLEIPAENLFDIATRILKDLNMYMITPEVTSTQQLFTGVARFYAQGVAGMKYAAYIEVVGKRKSRLIVKAWAEKEEALTGFYHKILEEIEKRTDIKLFVDDSLTQYNINSTTIQDSVIQRSNIGSGKRKCPQCGREAGDNERFCLKCGQKLD